MRILLDECAPRPLGRELSGHDVRTVPEMGWSGKKSGELLPLITSHPFDIFLTTDQNLRFAVARTTHLPVGLCSLAMGLPLRLACRC